MVQQAIQVDGLNHSRKWLWFWILLAKETGTSSEPSPSDVPGSVAAMFDGSIGFSSFKSDLWKKNMWHVALSGHGAPRKSHASEACSHSNCQEKPNESHWRLRLWLHLPCLQQCLFQILAGWGGPKIDHFNRNTITKHYSRARFRYPEGNLSFYFLMIRSWPIFSTLCSQLHVGHRLLQKLRSS